MWKALLSGGDKYIFARAIFFVISLVFSLISSAFYQSMKTNLLLLACLSIVSLVSCNSLENSSEYNLIPSGELIILPLDDSTPNISNGIQYFHGENPLLFNLNWSKNNLQIYDLHKEAKIKEIVFDQEGPEGVSEVFGIHVHNLDSIFLFNQGSGQIYLADTSGRVYNTIKYKAPDNYTPAFVHNTYFLSSPILNGDNLIVKTHFHGHIAHISNEELSEKELLYSVNLKTGSTQFLGLKYPSDYLVDGIKYVEPSITSGNNTFVISYFGDHRIYYVDQSEREMKNKLVKSRYVEERLPVLSPDVDPLGLRSYAYASPHYETITHDPFRNVYLRFAFHHYELDPDVPIHELRNYSGPFSIQILDKELNLISETAFEKNIYHPFDFFIGEEGLYLSINHPMNPENIEDEMAFELVRFQ